MLKINTIYLGDCLANMQQIEDKSIDLIVTDPPYLVNYKTCHRKNKEHGFTNPIDNDIDNDKNRKLISKYIQECHRILRDNTAMYMFCNASKVDFFKQELEKYFTIKNMIVMVKNNWTAGDLRGQFGKQYELIFLVNKGRALFNGRRISDVWYVNKVSNDKLLHQNQKPLETIKRCILKHSKEGDIVFDGFMGSGTTAIACIDTKRNYIGFEIDVAKYKIAIKRINEYSKQELIENL